MRHLLTGLLLVGLVVPTLRAEPGQAGDEFRTLKKQHDAATTKIQGLRRKLQLSKDDGQRKELQQQLQEQLAENEKAHFGRRFLEFAEKNPRAPTALEALHRALHDSDGPRGKSGVWDRAVELLRKDFVKAPEVKGLLRLLAYSGDENAEQFVRDVLKTNPDRVAQARAARALRNVAEIVAEDGRRLREDRELREQVEAVRGKEFVRKRIARGEGAYAEGKELEQLLRDRYADLVPDLSAGKKAPEVVSEDVDGKTVKLSDYRGKVVVLDVWATWCGPCRQMIPHQRELVERLQGRPFALISISADDDRETLKQFLAEHKLPWPQWWNGNEGGIVEDWDVKYFPTTFVIDAKGVIRFKDKRNKDLEAAVNQLLKETGSR